MPPQSQATCEVIDLGRYGKAVNGSIIAGLGAAVVAEQTPGITRAEWLTIGITFFTALGAIWNTTNSPPGASGPLRYVLTRRRPSPQGAHEVPAAPPT